MGVQAIDQTMLPLVLGKTKVFYCPFSFPIPWEKYFDLLPAIYCLSLFCVLYPMLLVSLVFACDCN